MRIFASDRLSSIMARLGMKEGESIVSPMVTRAIEKAQKRVEEQNFSSRKNLIEYDDVMNQQRQVIYDRRREALLGKADIHFLIPRVENLLGEIIAKYSPESLDAERWDFAAILKDLHGTFRLNFDLNKLSAEETNFDQILSACSEQVFNSYKQKETVLGKETMKQIESYVYLQILDQAWKEHLLGMDALKDSVSLRGYGQRDPLQEYKKEAFSLFALLVGRIEDETTLTLINMPMPEASQIPSFLNASEEDGGGEEDVGADLEFNHPSPEPLRSPVKALPSSQNQEDEKLIYHGTQSHPANVPKRNPTTTAPVRRETEKVGRNDPCPCGSGKKYKKCHGASGSGGA